MAAETKVKQKDISRFEAGKVKFIPNQYLVYLHNKGINLNWLFSGNGPSLFVDLTSATQKPNQNTGIQNLIKQQQEAAELKEKYLMAQAENKVFRKQIKELKNERKTLLEVFKALGKGNLFK